ncbi:Cupin 1 [Macrophomina phaseolina MS6]|uniref:Cupin 1 n=1 Tax=Macrophomina phaseolina (strain MS6) TaxID=1126212 RepID=K2RZ47_MACPH|nr:Cupin 1 [Macrophomina phaseolina MS6]
MKFTTTLFTGLFATFVLASPVSLASTGKTNVTCAADEIEVSAGKQLIAYLNDFNVTNEKLIIDDLADGCLSHEWIDIYVDALIDRIENPPDGELSAIVPATVKRDADLTKRRTGPFDMTAEVEAAKTQAKSKWICSSAPNPSTCNSCTFGATAILAAGGALCGFKDTRAEAVGCVAEKVATFFIAYQLCLSK